MSTAPVTCDGCACDSCQDCFRHYLLRELRQLRYARYMDREAEADADIESLKELALSSYIAVCEGQMLARDIVLGSRRGNNDQRN